MVSTKVDNMFYIYVIYFNMEYQHIHLLGSFNMVANMEIQLSDFLSGT